MDLLTISIVVLVAACVFVPLFVIAWFMLRSLRAAALLSVIFALGATVGFVVAAAAAQGIITREMDHVTREALLIAFATAGACAGGVLAVWAGFRKRGMPPWRRP